MSITVACITVKSISQLVLHPLVNDSYLQLIVNYQGKKVVLLCEKGSFSFGKEVANSLSNVHWHQQ